MNLQDQQKLERLVNQAVRGLPPRQAPDSLAARVQAEIARRAMLPWWRKSFAHWPIAAKALFVGASAAVASLVVAATLWVSAAIGALSLDDALAPAMERVQMAGRLLATAGEFATTVLGTIPPLWLYGGAAVIAGLYVALFGLGAAAYRTLYASA